MPTTRLGGERPKRLGLSLRYESDAPSVKPMPLGVELQRKLESATARLPRPTASIAGAINVEGALVESWRRRAMLDDAGAFLPPRPPVTARARPVRGSGVPLHHTEMVPSNLFASASAILQAPTSANLVERTSFAKRLELPRLGVHLVVDEPKSDYVPDRTAHEARRSQQVQRQRRVELSRFLFGKTKSATTGEGTDAASDDGDDTDDDARKNQEDDDPADELTAAKHVAEAASLALEALRGLPPGIVESAPYLSHVQQRSELELRMAQAALDSAEEARLFDAFARHLTQSGVEANAEDQAAIKRRFVEFAAQFVSRDKNATAAVAEQPPSIEASKPTAAAVGNPALEMRPQTGRRVQSAQPQRLRSASQRPPSAKFMFSANEKRSFLTELIERADSEQPAPLDDAPRPTEASLSPEAKPTTATTTSAERPHTSGAARAATSQQRNPSVFDIRGPPLVPATASAALTCEALRHTHDVKLETACSGTVITLEKQHAATERRKQISQLRFNVRSAKKTQDLYRRTVAPLGTAATPSAALISPSVGHQLLGATL